MDVVPYIPGDPMLIDRIVCELKSQGIFDSFRKECIADVDTKPAYQNLRQRVEGSVSGFLRKQKWSPEMNKNHVREMLRKNIYESGFLETGVERIVDQVVNPKMNTVFLPKVTEVVYKYLGIEKPTDNKDNLNITAENLLPKDLEAVSPVSDKKEDKFESSQNPDDNKMEEDESPPFEPIDDNILQEENSIDSHLSGFSGLISHDSNHSDSQKPLQIDTESQMSKHSTDAQSSFTTEEQKMEISEDSRQDSNSKSFEIETSSSNSTKIEKKKEEKKDDKKEEKKDDKKEEKKDDKKEEKKDDKKEEKKDDKKDDKKKERHRSSDKKDDKRDRKDSKTTSKDRDKSRDKKDSSRKSSDKYKSSSNSKYSTSSSNRDKSSSSRSKDKSDSKDRSKDKKDSKHDDKSKSSSNSKSDRHRKSSSSSHHSKDKKDKKHSKDDHYSSKHKSSSDRRSTDRDSNDGSGLKSSSSSYCESNSSSQTSTTQHSKIQDSTSNSNDSGNSDSVENKHETTLNLNEIPLGNKEFKLIKPKIASNIHEARRINKIRRQLRQIEQQSSIALNAIDEKINPTSEIKKEEELPIIFPPRISVSMASWDELEAKMNQNINFDSYCDPEDKTHENPQLAESIDDLSFFTSESITNDEIVMKKIEEYITSCFNEIKFLKAKMELTISNNIISNQKENKENKGVGIKRKLSDTDSFKKIKNNNNVIGVVNEEKFSLPLSPAESDASGDRKVDSMSEIESPIDGRLQKSNSKKQRYSSDDLYKPRPLITRGSRRRGAKLD